jgi:hypothetical protein
MEYQHLVGTHIRVEFVLKMQPTEWEVFVISIIAMVVTTQMDFIQYRQEERQSNSIDYCKPNLKLLLAHQSVMAHTLRVTRSRLQSKQLVLKSQQVLNISIIQYALRVLLPQDSMPVSNIKEQRRRMSMDTQDSTRQESQTGMLQLVSLIQPIQTLIVSQLLPCSLLL